jgi:hypothetical protein
LKAKRVAVEGFRAGRIAGSDESHELSGP